MRAVLIKYSTNYIQNFHNAYVNVTRGAELLWPACVLVLELKNAPLWV